MINNVTVKKKILRLIDEVELKSGHQYTCVFRSDLDSYADYHKTLLEFGWQPCSDVKQGFFKVRRWYKKPY